MNCRRFITIIAAVFFVVEVTQAKPLDIYDEMNDFLDDMGLDDPAPRASTSVRQQPENFCKMPARKGVCRALIPRWSYDPVAKQCVEFKFGGCDGNANNFASFKQCMQTCQGY